MKSLQSVAALDDFGRTRLSKSFFMREFLYSEIANLHGIPNIPDDPDLAIAAGTRLCTELLEPLQEVFGRIAIRSAYRSPAVNGYGNEQQKAGKAGYSCASNEANYASHILRIITITKSSTTSRMMLTQGISVTSGPSTGVIETAFGKAENSGIRQP